MRLGLREKILLITVITPLALGITALVTVHRNVKAHVESSSIHEGLELSVRVLESVLAARGRVMAGSGGVIAQDPRFFSLFMLRADQRDAGFLATVRGMARDFNRISEADLFEVMDRRGGRLASVGRTESAADWRVPLVREALRGRAATRVVSQQGGLYQVSVTPLRGDGRVVGALLLGSAIDERLARLLRAEMRSEVTFLSDGRIVGTTLDHEGDRVALMNRLASMPASGADFRKLGVVEIKGRGLTYVSLIRPIPDSDSSGARLYAMQRAFDPEIQFLDRMQKNLLLVALVALAAAVVTGLMLSSRITRPIRQLVRAAQEMQRGDYDHPVEVRSKDEIGFLADRFREMRQRERVYVSSLEEAARLKSRFISVVSHELRTPLSTIQAYQDLIEAGGLGEVPPSQKQALEAIREELQKLTRIAEQATQVAQIQGERLQLSLAPQPLASIVDRAVGAALASAPGRSVKVEQRLDAGLGPVWVDGQLFALALTNLVSNGIRFTPEAGRVEVEVRRLDDQLEIQVLDGGPGIPEERLAHLFEHGFSIRDPLSHHSSPGLALNSRGLGLGLGITRAIIEAHGGMVSAANRPAGGSVFVIRGAWFEAGAEPLAA